MTDIEQSVRAQLTAPDAPFETAVGEVLGVPMRVFRHRARSLRELLADSANHGDAECLVCREERISYREHLRRATSLARILHDDYGVRKGDRVAIYAANCAEWAVSFWATVSLGGIVAAMNGWWTPDEFTHALDLCEARLLIGDARRRFDAGADSTSVAATGEPK